MNKSLYRKEAIDAHRSQDKLNEPTRLIPLQAWFWLSAIAVLTFFALVWGIFGTVTHQVSGQGILTRGGGIVQVFPAEKSRLKAFHVKLGDHILEGQVVASLFNADEAEQDEETKLELNAAEQDWKDYSREETTSYEEKRKIFQSSEQALRQELKSAQSNLIQLQRILAQKEPLFRDGSITSDEFSQSQLEVDRQQTLVNSKQNALAQLRYELETFKDSERSGRLQRRHELDRMRRGLKYTQERLNAHEHIQSPAQGFVTELTAQVNDDLLPTEPILSFEMASKTDPIKAMIFVPAADGKRIRVGMPVQISPSTVKRREYGFMKGTVAQVSLYPISPENMKLHLRNDVLVQSLLEQGALIQVVVALETADTKSGFKWSTQEGPPVTIETGTLSQASIIVGTSRPIEFVFPYMKSLIWGR